MRDVRCPLRWAEGGALFTAENVKVRNVCTSGDLCFADCLVQGPQGQESVGGVWGPCRRDWKNYSVAGSQPIWIRIDGTREMTCWVFTSPRVRPPQLRLAQCSLQHSSMLEGISERVEKEQAKQTVTIASRFHLVLAGGLMG